MIRKDTGKHVQVNGIVVAPIDGDSSKEVKKYDVVVAATDVPGIQKLLLKMFDGIKCWGKTCMSNVYRTV